MAQRKRSLLIFFMLFLPTALILTFFSLQQLFPSLQRGVKRAILYESENFSLASYQDRQGETYLDFSRRQGPVSQLLVDRVYGYSVINGKIYVRGVTGAAVADPQNNTCLLYTDQRYPHRYLLRQGLSFFHNLKLFPQLEYGRICDLPQQYPAFASSPACRDSLGNGRFRIEEIRGSDGFRRLQLIDAQAREMQNGYTIRLLRDVESYVIQNQTLYARSRDGYARLSIQGEQYTLCYLDYGSKIYFSTLPDIQLVRDLSSFSPREQLLLKNLPAAGRC